MAPTTCALGTLAPGDSATVTIDVTMPATSGISTTAVATAPLVDLVPSNNSNVKFVDVILPSNFVVSTNADVGTGTLRQAILDANAHPGPDTISFNLPAGPGLTISLASELPRPGRRQWRRQHETAWDTLGPASAVHKRGAWWPGPPPQPTRRRLIQAPGEARPSAAAG